MRRIMQLLVLSAVIAFGTAGVASATSYQTSGFTIWTIAGTGVACTPPHCGDGGAATQANLSTPDELAVTKSGNVLVGLAYEHQVREITTSGKIELVAGTGANCASGNCGNGGLATKATLSFPAGVAVDSSGNIYISDGTTETVREISAKTHKIKVIAGRMNTACSTTPNCGNGGKATNAKLNNPLGLALRNGNLYIADYGDHEVRAVNLKTGKIKDVAGNGTSCTTAPSCGDGGSATAAELAFPVSLAFGSSGGLYISDVVTEEIRRVDPSSGIITDVAGNGHGCTAQPCGDGGPATSGQLSFPFGLAVDKAGDIYIGDQGDEEVREVPAATHNIITVAGNGTFCTDSQGPCGDGGAADQAELSSPTGVAMAPGGGLFVSQFGANKVRWLAPKAANAPVDHVARLASAAALNSHARIERHPLVGVSR